MTKDEKLIRVSYLLGLIPLTVGLLIFLSWWIGKAWFVTTLHKLENWGLMWILISVPLGLAGLLTSVIYFYRTNSHKAFLGLAYVLINIPTLLWILNTYEEIDKRAYVRVYNNTGSDFKSLTIKNSLYTEILNSIESNDYKTGYFYPNYVEAESMPEIEKVILLIKTDDGEKEIVMPPVDQGECLKVFIDSSFTIETKGHWEAEKIREQ